MSKAKAWVCHEQAIRNRLSNLGKAIHNYFQELGTDRYGRINSVRCIQAPIAPDFDPSKEKMKAEEKRKLMENGTSLRMERLCVESALKSFPAELMDFHIDYEETEDEEKERTEALESVPRRSLLTIYFRNL